MRLADAPGPRLCPPQARPESFSRTSNGSLWNALKSWSRKQDCEKTGNRYARYGRYGRYGRYARYPVTAMVWVLLDKAGAGDAQVDLGGAERDGIM